MKVIDLHFRVVPFIVLWEVVPTLICVCGWNPKVWILKWNRWAFLSYSSVYYAVQVGFNLWVYGSNPQVSPLKGIKATAHYYNLYFDILVLFVMLQMMLLTFESVDEILKCEHSNECYCAVLSCDAVYFLRFKVVLFFESVDETQKFHHSNECLKSLGAAYCILHKVVLAFESHANEILMNDLRIER